MHIGFTGTQRGMTEAQQETFLRRLEELKPEYGGLVFHHGDCIGADAEAQAIARKYGAIVAIHSHPTGGDKRAYTEGNDIVYEPKEPLLRNANIVAASDLLIATPSTYVEHMRSGTWATIRYARKKPIPVWIIWPDGNWRKEST